jgi:tetratricopeptide (TPR) repeat protein
VCAALDTFLNFSGHWDEWFALSRDAEARALSENDLSSAGWRAQTLANIHYQRNQSAELLTCADRCGAHWRAAHLGGREQAIAIRLRGMAHQVAKNYAAAINAYRESVELRRTLGPQNLYPAVGLNDLADVERSSGDFDSAECNYREALRIARESNDPHATATYIGNLAALTLDRKDWCAAEAYAREALSLSEELGRLELIAFASKNLGLSLVATQKAGSAATRRARG